MMSIDNPTGSPVLVRVGSPEIPNTSNADYTIPALGFKVLSVQGQLFGVAFTDAALISQIGAGNLTTRASVVLYSDGEIIPTFGAANYQSLSLADYFNGFGAYIQGTTQFFDISPWGGILTAIIPDAASGQSIVDVQVSYDTVGFTVRSLGRWAIWPGTPAIINVPRTARYVRFQYLSTGIAGEPIISGLVTIRATIAEIQQISFNPGSNSIVKNYNVPSLSSQSFFFATHNIKAVSVGLNNATSADLGEVVFYASSGVTGPWRLVSFREQVLNNTGIYASIYRNLGDLDNFLRVDILETGNSGPITGTLELSQRSAPELSSILQQIYAALGDIGIGANANQNIFYQLDSIRVQITNNVNGWLFSLDTRVNNLATDITTMLTTLTTIATSIGGGLSGIISAMSSTVSTISSTAGLINSATSAINTAVGTINGIVATINTNIASMLTSMGANLGSNIASMLTSMGASLGSNIAALATSVASNLGANVSSILTTSGLINSVAGAINTTLGTVSTNVSSVLSNVSTIATSIGAGLGTNISNIYTRMGIPLAANSQFQQPFTLPTAATFFNTAVDMPNGAIIQKVQLGYNITGRITESRNRLGLYYGTAAAPIGPLYEYNGDTVPASIGPQYDLQGVQGSGSTLNTPNVRLWLYSEQAPCIAYVAVNYK